MLVREKWILLQYFVLVYLFFVLLSLLFSETIQDTTPLKLLLSGVFLFFLLPSISPTKKQRIILVHVLGGVAVFIATLAVLQVIFPEVLNIFAEKFLFGRKSYGIAIEFNRGRLLHWGSLIFIFPFFYSSTLLFSWRKRVWTALYIFYGYASISFAMVVANFRWTFVVFAVISFLYGVYAYKKQLLSRKKMYFIIFTASIMSVVAIVMSGLIFGYTLFDRFLLKDASRDIAESLGRVTLYNQALTVFQSYPLFGAGYGNYYSMVWAFPHFRYYSEGDQYDIIPVPIASHNEFLTVLAETGVFGLLSFVFIIYFTGKKVIQNCLEKFLTLEDRFFALSLCGSFFSIILYVLFENIYPQNIIFILFLASGSYAWINPIVKRT